MSDEEFLCVRCSRHMLTCCQTSEVYATPGDVRRIRAHTGRNDFYERRVPDDPVYLAQDDDPPWREQVFAADGSRRVLRREENGNCTFLGAQGCSLPGDVRPLVCRIYPFLYTAQGIEEKLGEGCPRELLRPKQSLIVALGMDRAAAERWRAQLYEEIKEERACVGDP
jgi:Fe-S-cluster containining protein